MHDELTGYLEAIDGNECYRVDSVLKESPQEITERVFFIGANGEEQGPLVRKRFRPDSKAGTAYQRIFEAQQMGKRFLHLPRIFECKREESVLTVVMEWVEGETVMGAVSNRGGSFDYASTVFPILCDAVLELHEGFEPPIIHRDLTPSNVIVSPSGLTLVDFGIARTFNEDAEQDTTCFGTRSYAPPEQFGYGQTDVRSDVYALGMLLCFCIVGQVPSPATLKEDLSNHDVSEEMRKVILKATAFDPQARYENVRELKDAFNAAVFSSAAAHSVPPQDFPPPTSQPVILEDKGAVSTVKSKKLLSASSILRWIGIVWNIVLIAIWGMFAIAAVSLTFFPNEQALQISFPARLVMYLGIFVVGDGFLSYALMDKRRLRKRFPGLSKRGWKRETLICIGIALAVTLVSAIVGSAIT